MTFRVLRFAFCVSGMLGLVACGETQDIPQQLAVRQLELAGQVLKVQVADDDAEREKGLMFVKSMPDMEGMLFTWPEAHERSFWMRNTYIPLDLIYIRQGKIVSMIAWAKPFDETGLPSGGPADMVLEVNGGWAGAHKVQVGASVTLK